MFRNSGHLLNSTPLSMRIRRNPSLVMAALIAGATLASVRPNGGVPATGSIEGEVVLNARPPRRSASRYPGAGIATHLSQAIPAVAYLEGSVPGVALSLGAPPEIAQMDTVFAPAVTVVPVGTTVEFPNRDPFFHNVFSYSSTERFDLGRYPQGESKSVEFTEAGLINVYCEVHESMRSVVLVVENPFHTIVAQDGGFSITGVPPGEYTLVVWHADLGEARQSVVVRDGSATNVSMQLGG